MKKISEILSLAFLILITLPINASALSLDFERITNNASVDVASQLSAEVSDAGSGLVLIQFFNAGPNDAFIAQVYLDDLNSLLAFSSFDAANTSAGVVFATPTSPSNLPGGNTVSFFADFSAGKTGAASNGINISEYIGILFTGVFANVVADIIDGDLRLGMHVQGIDPQDQSDGFVNSTEVPEPASMALLAMGLAGFAARRRKA